MAYLIERTSKYRIDSEERVKEFIEEQKSKAHENGYGVKKYSSTFKEKKSKGEVIDEGYEVSITTVHGSFWEL